MFLDREGSAYSLAKGQLESVIKAVDDVLDSSAPGYKDYLKVYAQRSKNIEKVEAAQGFRGKVLSTIPDPINVGQFMISQPKFVNAIRAAAKETDMSQMQVKILERVGRDLDSGVLNKSGRVPGSDTFKNLFIRCLNHLGNLFNLLLEGPDTRSLHNTIAVSVTVNVSTETSDATLAHRNVTKDHTIQNVIATNVAEVLHIIF